MDDKENYNKQPTGDTEIDLRVYTSLLKPNILKERCEVCFNPSLMIQLRM